MNKLLNFWWNAQIAFWRFFGVESVTTIHGVQRTSLLERREGRYETEFERTTWVEYWQRGVLVHRSANIGLKGSQATFEAGRLG